MLKGKMKGQNQVKHPGSPTVTNSSYPQTITKLFTDSKHSPASCRAQVPPVHLPCVPVHMTVADETIVLMMPRKE